MVGLLASDNVINQIKDGAKKIRVGIKPEGRLIAREKTKIYNESDQVIWRSNEWHIWSKC